jgi:putative ABC transport system permease protein
MFDRDKWLEILQVLMRNPVRSFLSALGVAWGIFMLILMVSAGRGLKNGVTSDFGDGPTNSMFLWTQSTSMPHEGYDRGRRFSLNNSDVEYLQENLPEMQLISPRNQLGGYRDANNVIRGTEAGAFSVYGDYPEYQVIEPMDIYNGRFLNQRDIDDKRKVCVIGSQVYNQLFEPTEEPVGDYVQINGVMFKVIGVYRPTGSGEEAEEEAQSIYVPFTTFQKAFNYGDRVGWLSMMSVPGVKVSEMEEKAKLMLKERKSVHPDDPRAFGSWNMEKEFEEMNMVFTAIEIVGFVIGTLALLAGVIGITNIMLITVRERTKEFGVRRALGATPNDVVKQVLTETLMLTTLAGFAGLSIGILLVESVNKLLAGMGTTGAFRNPEIGLLPVMIALFVLIGAGALAGLLPAVRATSVRPVDAIRAE